MSTAGCHGAHRIICISYAPNIHFLYSPDCSRRHGEARSSYARSSISSFERSSPQRRSPDPYSPLIGTRPICTRLIRDHGWAAEVGMLVFSQLLWGNPVPYSDMRRCRRLD
eukprot:313404-Rhodomonas_salina.1